MNWLPYRGGHSPDLGMGHFHVPIEVSHRAGGRVVTVKALVDTGATYTQIPRDVLEGLGVPPEQEWPFELADGREVLYPIAWITVRLRRQQQPTIAVFGEPDTEPILGVVTLEEFRVAADPVRGRLVPVPGRMKRARASWRKQVPRAFGARDDRLAFA